jgi:hypothetical protein
MNLTIKPLTPNLTTDYFGFFDDRDKYTEAKEFLSARRQKERN